MIVTRVGIARPADIGPRFGGPLRADRAAIAVARQLGRQIAAEEKDFVSALATPSREVARRMPAAHVGRANGRIFRAATQNDLFQFGVAGLRIGQDDGGDRRRKQPFHFNIDARHCVSSPRA